MGETQTQQLRMMWLDSVVSRLRGETFVESAGFILSAVLMSAVR